MRLLTLLLTGCFFFSSVANATMLCCIDFTKLGTQMFGEAVGQQVNQKNQGKHKSQALAQHTKPAMPSCHGVANGDDSGKLSGIDKNLTQEAPAGDDGSQSNCDCDDCVKLTLLPMDGESQSVPTKTGVQPMCAAMCSLVLDPRYVPPQHA